jgi:hypothetical protein
MLGFDLLTRLGLLTPNHHQAHEMHQKLILQVGMALMAVDPEQD